MNILHNFQKSSTFILQDDEIFNMLGNTLQFTFNPTYKITTPLIFLKQLFYLLKNLRKYDIIVSQMAAYHTIIPSLLSKFKIKKHIIILHGTDSLVLEEIGYGNLSRPILGFFTKFSILNASYLLPVSGILIDSQNSYLSEKPKKMGLKTILKSNLPEYKIIPNGISTEKFFIQNNVLRTKNSFITVSAGLDLERTYLRKGIDLLLQFARLNPEFKFTIVGSKNIFNYNDNLQNVEIISFTSSDQLMALYNQHQFYFQLSMVEGFGVSLCEAMLCGCIPIVSAGGMMDEIIGQTGYVISKKKIEILDSVVKNAIDTYHIDKTYEARNRICSSYPLEKRKNSLNSFLSFFS